MANIFTRKLFELPRTNWWLLIGIGIPFSIFYFFVPSERVHGFAISDWEWILFYIHGVGFTGLFSSWTLWGFDGIGGALFDGFAIPFAIGYFGQFFGVIVWRVFHHQPIFRA